MRNFNKIVQELKNLGVENPSRAQVERLAVMVLDSYRVEIFRAELEKLDAMREECAQRAEEALRNNLSIQDNGCQGLIEIVTDAIRLEAKEPDLTHTVRYLVMAEF